MRLQTNIQLKKVFNKTKWVSLTDLIQIIVKQTNSKRSLQLQMSRQGMVIYLSNLILILGISFKQKYPS